MPYAEAMAKYGSDKPDLRFGLEIQDFGPHFAESPFGIFREAVAHGGTVRGFVIPGAGGSSRREVDETGRAGQAAGAAGLVWARCTADGVAGVGKGDGRGGHARGARRRGCDRRKTSLVLASRRRRRRVEDARASCVSQVAKKENLIPDGQWELHWVTDFPLFDWNADEKRWDSVNHPFTAPREEDLPLLEVDPGQGAGQGLRRDPEWLGARRRQHPYPRPRDAGRRCSACSV